MSLDNPRFLFVCLCWIGMIVILLGAVWEVRERLLYGALDESHFWVRLASAFCWLTSLGMLSFAVAMRWPVPGDEASKQEFARYLLLGLSFLLVAMVVSIVDFALFWRIKNRHRHQMAEEMDRFIHDELEAQDHPVDDKG